MSTKHINDAFSEISSSITIGIEGTLKAVEAINAVRCEAHTANRELDAHILARLAIQEQKAKHIQAVLRSTLEMNKF